MHVTSTFIITCSSTQGREAWIVKLRGIDSLNDSQLLRGQTLLVDSADRPFLEDEDDFLTQVALLETELRSSGLSVGSITT